MFNLKKLIMKTLLFSSLMFLVIFSCDDNKMQSEDSQLILTRSETEFTGTLNGNPAGKGDSFNIQSFSIEGDSAFITITYAGGCNRHTFEVIWSETYIETYPPQTDLMLVHNANGDACKALITEKITFNISKLTGPIDYETVVVNVLNGHSPGGPAISGNWNPSDINVYNVVFPEGDLCQVEVTASTAICGAGLWENLWLALNDSVNAGVEGTYFKKWLQPVALSENIKNFKAVPGKKYLIGARIQKDHSFNNVVICLAYPGPSVPVKITCVRELK